MPVSTALLKSSDWLRHLARRKHWKPELALGRRGEDLAHRFLRRRGYLIVARNYALASGDAEADLIAWHREKLVFVEVKSRSSTEFGPPDRAVSAAKMNHLRRVAREYTRKADIPMENIRFDVVTVVFAQPVEIQLELDAFSI